MSKKFYLIIKHFIIYSIIKNNFEPSSYDICPLCGTNGVAKIWLGKMRCIHCGQYIKGK